ncbi:MAG: M61 family metallopeptidase [Acidobacteria bacterium]|nr:M61 family metallopeptidase [Acidobacteriota bacterium]MBI3488635.1 M61 family metallopeptidase [Acidobacteriota bacterium]
MRVLRLLICLVLLGPAMVWSRATTRSRGGIAYTIRIPRPQDHKAEVSVRIPTEGQAVLDLMMPRWSPGYYAVQDLAARVQDLAAAGVAGKPLKVEHPAPNRWRVRAAGAREITLFYRLDCPSHFVTTNLVTGQMAILSGPATFITPVPFAGRSYEVVLDLPPGWTQCATGLEAAPAGRSCHFTAPDYDTLLDCPLAAGAFSTHTFEVGGIRHELVDIGDYGAWDGARAGENLATVVKENQLFWGRLPYRKYVFLNVFGPGAGGLEHQNSAMLSSMPPPEGKTGADFRWYSYVSHEFFHGYNVKRLRPVELGPFDYERPPRTAGLWVAEGLTTYYGPVMAVRAGLGTPEDFLAELSGAIRRLQQAPGRLKQTLERASLDVWDEGGSGVGGDPDKGVSYYVKGPVVGFLLDARIRMASKDKRSLDDLMRLAFRRFSGRTGFTEAQFRAAAEEVAGTSLRDWFRRHLASTEELDYREALDCFGLRFAAPAASGQPSWTLEVDPGAGLPQKARLADLLKARRADARS